MTGCARPIFTSIQLILEYGCNINIINIHGYSALLIAIRNQNIEYINKLIEYGADLEIRVPGMEEDKRVSVCMCIYIILSCTSLLYIYYVYS